MSIVPKNGLVFTFQVNFHVNLVENALVFPFLSQFLTSKVTCFGIPGTYPAFPSNCQPSRHQKPLVFAKFQPQKSNCILSVLRKLFANSKHFAIQKLFIKVSLFV
jgi:hypothetical protein